MRLWVEAHNSRHTKPVCEYCIWALDRGVGHGMRSIADQPVFGLWNKWYYHHPKLNIHAHTINSRLLYVQGNKELMDPLGGDTHIQKLGNPLKHHTKALTLSFLGVINFKFPLQPHQEYNNLPNLATPCQMVCLICEWMNTCTSNAAVNY